VTFERLQLEHVQARGLFDRGLKSAKLHNCWLQIWMSTPRRSVVERFSLRSRAKRSWIVSSVGMRPRKNRS